ALRLYLPPAPLAPHPSPAAPVCGARRPVRTHEYLPPARPTLTDQGLGVSTSGTIYQASPLAKMVDDLALVPLFLPLLVGLALALLRSRLWDVVSLINRALVYALLTSLLAALYSGLILGLERLAGLITGQEDQPVVIVLSTLALAGLFYPLRRRIQALIDRR